MAMSAGTLWVTDSSAESNAMAMKLTGSRPTAAVRKIAAVPVNSALFRSIQSATAASDQVAPPNSSGIRV